MEMMIERQMTAIESIIFDSAKVHNLWASRNSSSSPLLIAYMKHRETKWRVASWYIFYGYDSVTLWTETFDSIEAIIDLIATAEPNKWELIGEYKERYNNMEQQNYKAPLKLFHWHKEKRLLTSEISTIQANVPELDGVGLPQFLTIFNPDTNQDRTFRYVKKETDREGDVTAWIYENLSHNLHLTIWND